MTRTASIVCKREQKAEVSRLRTRTSVSVSHPFFGATNVPSTEAFAEAVLLRSESAWTMVSTALSRERRRELNDAGALENINDTRAFRVRHS